MATYAVQFITRDGAFCGQTVTNRGRALTKIQDDWIARHIACVVVVVTANSSVERLKLRATAVSQVFHERVRAVDWLKQLLTDEEQES